MARAEGADPRRRGRPHEPLRLPGARSMFFGLAGFVLFTAVGVFAVSRWVNVPQQAGTFARQGAGPLSLLFLLMIMDYVLGGLRYRMYFDGHTLPFVSLWDCMRSNWANMFLGAVTPAQTGGGPAQLYVLWRCGVKVSQGALVLLVNFAATFIVFLVAGAMALALLPDAVIERVSPSVIRGGAVVLAGLAAIILLAFAIPHKVVAFVRGMMARIPSRLLRVRRATRRLEAIMVRELRHYQTGKREVLGERKHLLVLTVVVTAVLYLNKYLLGYLLARSLSDSVPFATVIGLQVVQYAAVYFAPTPGAAGLAELSSAWLMAAVLAPEVLLLYAVIWRFFSTMLGAMLGAGVLAADFYALSVARNRKDSAPAAAVPMPDGRVAAPPAAP